MDSEIEDLQSELQKLSSMVSKVAASRIRTTHEGIDPIASIAIAAAAGFPPV
jgi:hypothetical protein